jgi:hypothetical protein
MKNDFVHGTRLIRRLKRTAEMARRTANRTAMERETWGICAWPCDGDVNHYAVPTNLSVRFAKPNYKFAAERGTGCARAYLPVRRGVA